MEIIPTGSPRRRRFLLTAKLQLQIRVILKSPLMLTKATAPEMFSATIIAFLLNTAAHCLSFFQLSAKPILPTAAAVQFQFHHPLCCVLSPRNCVCSMALLCNSMPSSLVFSYRSFCSFAPSLQHALHARCLRREAFVVNLL
jgi:hypothetical protein